MTALQDAPDILSAEFARNPYPYYRIMRDQHPLIWHEGMQSYIVSRYDDVEKAFRDPVFTSKNYDWQLEPVHGRTILQMDGREHATHRALVSAAFRGNELETKFRPVIERNSRELIERLRGRNPVDLVEAFATRFPINVIVDMLGLPKSDHDRFHRWYTSIMAFLSNLTQDPDVMAEGARTRDEFAAYLIPIIRQRRADPGDDLLSTLCAAEIDGERMTDEEIKAFCSLLLTAGGETTDKAITSMMKNLLEHPEQLDAVRADRTLIGAAFAETLRFSPPVHMIMRQPDEDVELSGGVVPAGSTVTCLIGAAGRDDRHYANPENFDIFRDDLTTTKAFSAAADHLAFCLGRHFCVGAMLAKTEIEIGVGMLLDAMPTVRFSDGAPPEAGVFTRAPTELWVDCTPA
ncbi:cytochrome P450 [Prauserella rugosa]|uniref:Pulcherriminic acid synthase n=1 Tax=Prauserella rugosa TaxID=43354 RepID=A0A660C638_9PSEU|nr:cytochrome P450 [Prauserella rugosa]KMS90143.1 cytochrome P450 [Streptomyces regensis]TWH18806.1 pulcherriminic acid synthase [Prauserella rugosa]